MFMNGTKIFLTVSTNEEIVAYFSTRFLVSNGISVRECLFEKL